ncbi:MAG: hypothetical protein IH596_00545 [Bacteroidales bacterium]|nr:hypothetical protein [Bacteroidales bacterium]
MEHQPKDRGKYSPEVEEILHKRPSLLVRKGIFLLTILVILLLITSQFIKYPERLAASLMFVTLSDSTPGPGYGEVILTEAAASIVQVGQPVVMVLSSEDGKSGSWEVTGNVGELVSLGQGDYFRVVILPDAEDLPETLNAVRNVFAGAEGTAYIMIGETSLLEKILNPVFAVFRSADQ